MLAIISDLHFCDGTATERNVKPDAFELALEEIYSFAQSRRAKRVELVLLGDVFDFLRTEYWFGPEVQTEAKPWGDPDALDGVTPASVKLHARKILDRILEVNAEALATLKRGDTTRGLEVTRTYLTGNHDRLALTDHDSLMKPCLEAIGASLPEEGPHKLLRPEYGVLARHGHEWDWWNFERYDNNRKSAEYAAADYLPTPIGDPITTELVARLPYEVKRRLAGSSLTPEELSDVYRHMQRIEDVRPLVAALQWPFYEANRVGHVLSPTKSAEVKRALGDAVVQVISDFQELRYYGVWRERHRLAGVGFDLLLHVIRRTSLDQIEDFIEAFDGAIARLTGEDDNRTGAFKEDLSRTGAQGLRSVVYGHTHEPLQVALRATPGTRDAYVNTGTFRQRVYRADDKKSFLDWEHLTYTCFLNAEELAAGPQAGPGFDSWTGTRARS